MEHDAEVKRAIFIGNSVEIRESFRFASPVEILYAMKVYCSSFYGSMLCELGGEGANKVFNSWTTAVKLTWDVPRATRSYLVQQVLDAGFTSAKVDILTRFSGFFQSLRKSPSYEVSVMAGLAGRDLRSTTGRNLRLVQDLSGLDPWETSLAKLENELIRKFKVDVPPTDKWRAPYLASLLEKRQRYYYQGDIENMKTVSVLINSLCIN